MSTRRRTSPTVTRGSRPRLLLRSFLLVLAPALVVAACGEDGDGGGDGGDAGADASEALGTDTLRWVVPFSPGGGTDTTTRQLQPLLEDALGMPIEIENIEGGSQSIGTNVALNEGGAECQTVFTQAIPHISLSWMLQDVDYTYDDVAAIGNVVNDGGVIRVANDARWNTAEELIQEATESPGEITMSTSGFSSANYLALVQIMEATGAEFNIVNFDGGNPARTAVVSGEVDATHATVYNSLHVAEDTRVLAVHMNENQWPDLTDDAPPLSEALGVDLPEAPSRVGVFTAAACRDDHPDRYQVLHDALEQVVTSDEFSDTLAETDEEGKIGYMSGEELDQFISDQAVELASVVEGIEELELVQDPR